MFKGVYRARAKGRQYFYAWRGGPKLCGDPLLDTKAAEEFLKIKASLSNSSQSSLFPALVSRFRKSPEHQARSNLWKKESEKIQDVLCDEFGDADIGWFQQGRMMKHVYALRDKNSYRPRQADKIISELRTVLCWAQQRGEIDHHVVRRIPKLSKSNRSHIIWETADIESVCAALSDNAKPMVLLAAHTGLDLKDLCRLTWSQVGLADIQGKRSKTGQDYYIPILPAIRKILDGIERKAPAVLLNTLGRPWTPDGFGSTFQKAKRKAGIKGLRFKDLRGTSCTNFIIQGMTSQETGEAMGWSLDNVERISRRYIHREKVAMATISRLNVNKTVKLTVKPV